MRQGCATTDRRRQIPAADRAPHATIAPYAPVLTLLLFALDLAGSLPYPLGARHESVANYAHRLNLPPTKTLELGRALNS